MSKSNQKRIAQSANRRAFLRGMGALGVASIFVPGAQAAQVPRVRPTNRSQGEIAPPSPASARYANRFELHAEGIAENPPMVWPTPEIPPLPEGIVVKVRMDFPWVEEEEGGRVRDLLQLMVFAAPASEGSAPVAVISRFHQFAEKIVISNQPYNWFSIYGPIVANPVLSPFGNLVGLTALNSAQFDEVATDDNDVTHFTLLGGHAAANHATAVMHAVGELRIRGPWHSF